MVHALTDAEFDAQVLQSPLPVLVDFWAPWCGPCKAMLPIIEELEQQYAGKVTFAKINVDENVQIPSHYNVMSIPTFIIFQGGSVAAQFVGARSKAEMQKAIDSVLAS